jgi:hypothetical protein
MPTMSSPDIAVEPKPLPPEIDRWNWGAFFLSWIWGIGNATPIALLALVPLVGFVMLFVLGARGSRWAWRNKRWDSVEHFKRVQRKWAISGLVIWIAGFGFWAAIFFGTFSILRHSEAYQIGVAKLQTSPVATNALGTPIAAGKPSGSVSTSSDTGKASLNFSVSGPRAAGTAFVEAIKKDGVWTITRLAFKLDGSDNVIDIIGGAHSSST